MQEQSAMTDLDVLVPMIILVVLWWLLASIAVAIAARQRGRSGSAWFELSVGLGPLFAIILLLAYPAETMAEDRERGDLSILSHS
jgi:hypothetical protein